MKRKQYNKKNLIGRKFGNLTVIEELSKKAKQGYVIWKCKCDCGNMVTVSGTNLRNGSTQSCGCLYKETHTTHGATIGKSHSKNIERLYYIWENMKKRCHSKSNKDYKYYGAKGIKVCDEWKNDYSAFKKWVLENGYRDNLTIDRVNSCGDYCPNNCRWVPMSENTRRVYKGVDLVTAWNIWFEYTHTNTSYQKLADFYGKSKRTIQYIVKGYGKYNDILDLARQERELVGG